MLASKATECTTRLKKMNKGMFHTGMCYSRVCYSRVCVFQMQWTQNKVIFLYYILFLRNLSLPALDLFKFPDGSSFFVDFVQKFGLVFLVLFIF